MNRQESEEQKKEGGRAGTELHSTWETEDRTPYLEAGGGAGICLSGRTEMKERVSACKKAKLAGRRANAIGSTPDFPADYLRKLKRRKPEIRTREVIWQTQKLSPAQEIQWKKAT